MEIIKLDAEGIVQYHCIPFIYFYLMGVLASSFYNTYTHTGIEQLGRWMMGSERKHVFHYWSGRLHIGKGRRLERSMG